MLLEIITANNYKNQVNESVKFVKHVNEIYDGFAGVCINESHYAFKPEDSTSEYLRCVIIHKSADESVSCSEITREALTEFFRRNLI